MLTLVLVASCSSAEEDPDASEGHAEVAPTPEGFTDFSGVVIATVTGGDRDWEDTHNTMSDITVSVYDPESDTRLFDLPAGQVGSRTGSPEDGRLIISPDFSHLAYLEHEHAESDILIYRLEGQTDEAQLVHRIEPPSGISGTTSHGRLAFQPDGQRLWYSLEGDGDEDDEEQIRSIGVAQDEEPRDEENATSSAWVPEDDGSLSYVSNETVSGEADGGSYVATRQHRGDTTYPTRVVFTEGEGARSPQVTYARFARTEDDRIYLAGGRKYKSPRDGDHQWGAIMKFTFDEEGDIEAHETILQSTEEEYVSHIITSPDRDFAFVVDSGDGIHFIEARSTFYYMDLSNPQGALELENVFSVEELDSYQSPQFFIMGWMS
ncbi:hypothetical protein [Nocardiopsis alba]|uniref:hypothetical protein n=1 Tax=Nocardiopsis alba TaxID=53437 RepID=UPI0033AD3BEA